MRKRKGFTLIEMIAATIMLAIIVISCAALSRSISAQKTVTESTVYLSTHNLNCMERLRQMAATLGQTPSEHLVEYYGDDVFGSMDIETHVYVETATLEQFYVYSVVIQSKMRDLPQRLTSRYILTSIGLTSYDEAVQPDYGLPGEEGNPAGPGNITGNPNIH